MHAQFAGPRTEHSPSRVVAESAGASCLTGGRRADTGTFTDAVLDIVDGSDERFALDDQVRSIYLQQRQACAVRSWNGSDGKGGDLSPDAPS